jgi:hypothetical protein
MLEILWKDKVVLAVIVTLMSPRKQRTYKTGFGKRKFAGWLCFGS